MRMIGRLCVGTPGACAQELVICGDLLGLSRWILVRSGPFLVRVVNVKRHATYFLVYEGQDRSDDNSGNELLMLLLILAEGGWRSM